MKSRTTTLYLTFCLSFIVLLVCGCAGLSLKSPESSLQERVNGFMQAQINQQWNDAYRYHDSAYRKLVSKDDYLRRPRQMQISAYEIKSITVGPSEKTASVKLKLDLKIQGYEFKGGPQTQKWVKEYRKWFIKIQPSGVGGPLK